MIVSYQTLSRNERRAAQKLAKQLLRTTLPASKGYESGCSLRGTLSTAFMKPENVIAAFVYDDGNGNWWGDVVLRKGRGTHQIGRAEDSPYRSKEEAFVHVQNMIANIKSTREHPLVGALRRNDIEVEAIELLRVRHEQFGCRWIMRHVDEIPSEVKEFERTHGITDRSDPTVMCYAVKMARAIVLYYAPEFATGGNFLSPPSESDKSEFEINLWREAASFLLAHGIINIDDQEETDVAYGRVSPVPDENGEFPVHVQLPKCLSHGLN
jgi:hypothetical protein